MIIRVPDAPVTGDVVRWWGINTLAECVMAHRATYYHDALGEPITGTPGSSAFFREWYLEQAYVRPGTVAVWRGVGRAANLFAWITPMDRVMFATYVDARTKLVSMLRDDAEKARAELARLTQFVLDTEQLAEPVLK